MREHVNLKASQLGFAFERSEICPLCNSEIYSSVDNNINTVEWKTYPECSTAVGTWRSPFCSSRSSTGT
jgi:hypothetical protein